MLYTLELNIGRGIKTVLNLVLSAVYLQETGILRNTRGLALRPAFALIKKLVAVISITYPVFRTWATVTF